MNRIGLAVALAIGTVVGLIFGLWPALDLKISELFFYPERGDFLLNQQPELLRLRDVSLWIIAAIATPAVLSLCARLLMPRSRPLLPNRAAILMITTLAIGPGLLTNVVLKDHWGRPRPIDVRQFHGDDRFVPWWDPRGGCPKNCSFIGGESSGAFWTLAPAALTPLPWRPLAYGAAILFGSAVGTLRIAFGGHFFSDVAFSGVITFLVIWATHGLLYRWPATRASEADIDEAIKHLAVAVRTPLMTLTGRVIDVGHRIGRRLSGDR